MQQLLNALKAHAAGLDAAQAQPRFGTVQSVDPSTATARVLLQPEAILTGWLPVLTAWAGNGWGIACPPVPGQQVLVVAQEGEAEHGVILGAAFSQTTRPPNAQSGELWLVHQSGSSVRLLNSGTIALAGPVSITGNVQISGMLSVGGEVIDLGGQHGSLDDLRQAYDRHTHASNGSPPSIIV